MLKLFESPIAVTFNCLLGILELLGLINIQEVLKMKHEIDETSLFFMFDIEGESLLNSEYMIIVVLLLR